jgi:hypothetical protein
VGIENGGKKFGRGESDGGDGVGGESEVGDDEFETVVEEEEDV